MLIASSIVCCSVIFYPIYYALISSYRADVDMDSPRDIMDETRNDSMIPRNKPALTPKRDNVIPHSFEPRV